MLRKGILTFFIMSSFLASLLLVLKMNQLGLENKLQVDSSNSKFIKNNISLYTNKKSKFCSNEFILSYAKRNNDLITCSDTINGSNILLTDIKEYSKFKDSYVVINKLNKEQLIIIERSKVNEDYIKYLVKEMFNDDSTISFKEAEKIANSPELENLLIDNQLDALNNINYSYFNVYKKVSDTKELLAKIEDSKKAIENKIETAIASVKIEQKIKELNSDMKSNTEYSCLEGFVLNQDTNTCYKIIKESDSSINTENKTVVLTSENEDAFSNKTFENPLKELIQSFFNSIFFHLIVVAMIGISIFGFLQTGNFSLIVTNIIFIGMLFLGKNIFLSF